METNEISEILKQNGFAETNQKGIYEKYIDEKKSIKAYVNGKGVILHRVEKGEKQKKMNVQADTPEDFKESLNSIEK